MIIQNFGNEKKTNLLIINYFQNGQTALSIAQKLGYISVVETLKVVTDEVPAVPRKGFGSADSDIIYTINLSYCTQSADPNPFRGTHCTYIFNFLVLIFFIFDAIFEFTKKYSKIKIATGLEKY